MQVIRADRKQGYTNIPNCLTRSKSLSNKALGLLVRMLGLPPGWVFTQKGLSSICGESVGSVSSSLKELEAAGHLLRSQKRGGDGRLGKMEYVIYEEPQKAKEAGSEKAPIRLLDPTATGSPPTIKRPAEKTKQPSALKENGATKPFPPLPDFPVTAKPPTGKPSTGKPSTGKPSQSITYKLINKSNTNTNQSINPSQRIDATDAIRRATEGMFKENLNYDQLREDCGEERVDGLIGLLTDVCCTKKSTVSIGGEDISAGVVRARFGVLTDEHIRYVFDAIESSSARHKITNMRGYLLKSLYEAPNIIDCHIAHMAAYGMCNQAGNRGQPRGGG